MNREARFSLFKRHRVGLIALLSIYIMLTVVRSIRDDFAVEIWQELGVSDEPEVFTRSEFWVMVCVILTNGLAFKIKNNQVAFISTLSLLCVGFIIVLGSVFGQQSGQLSPMMFMVLLGLGMYIPYVAFHTTLFERMLAAFRETGTIGYLMYLADAFGYLGYVAVMIFRNTASDEDGFLDLVNWVSVAISIVSTLIAVGLVVYYRRVFQDSKTEQQGNSYMVDHS